MVCASKTTGSRIAGGFVLLNVAALVTAWRACQARPLGIGDFRAWLACRELEARRCAVEAAGPGVPFKGVPSKVVPSYRVAELAKLLGVTEKRARASVRRLVEGGLIEWSDSAIGFPDPRVEQADDLDNTIGRGRGDLAIPRRMLRFLIAGARPALIATVLGLLFRCLSRRKAGFDGRGRVKASWIARVFAMDLRRIKAARRELVALGWIEPESSSQSAENRWGRAYRIDLAWDRGEAGGRSLPPPPALVRPAIATPSVNQEPLRERIQNQEPARGPSGFSIQSPGEEDRPPDGPLPAPKLADVHLDDLKDTGRLLELHRQAVAKGLVTASEADRLKFIAAAEHALAIASNAPALFAWLVLNGCWRYITGADEDRANARIKAHLRGPDPAPVASPTRVFTAGIPLPTSSPPSESPGARYTACTPLPGMGIQCRPLATTQAAPILNTAPGRIYQGHATGVNVPARHIQDFGLSEDARIVKAIREASIRAGIYRDPFPEFSARYPEWTRPRWDAALADLGLPVPGR
jgi:hypothetical protein